jgi:hypothetical protein
MASGNAVTDVEGANAVEAEGGRLARRCHAHHLRGDAGQWGTRLAAVLRERIAAAGR